MKIALLARLLGLAIIALPAVYGSPSSLSSPTSAPPSLSTITIAGQIFVVDPANLVLDSTTIQPGSAGISIDGQVVSADAAHDLFVDGTEILAQPTGLTFASDTAVSNTTSLSSSNVTFSRTISASSVTGTAAGFNNLGSVIAGVALQLASTLAIQSAADLGTTSVSASTSLATASSSGSAPLQSAAISSASSAMTSSSLLGVSPAGAAPNVQANSSKMQSESTASVSMSSSTPTINLIPTNSSIRINSSSGLYFITEASQRFQSASSNPQSMSSAEIPSQSVMLVPGAQPNTITTGPTLASPTVSLNPTGSVASSQGMLLVGAIFGITAEAKTLSAIIKDDGPKQSFISKIKGTDDDTFNLLEDEHPPGPPPSYEEACLDGASIFDPVKLLGCLKSGFDDVIDYLEDEPPDMTRIETIFDNIGKLAENLEKEEDDDDDETSTSETDSQASQTQDSATKGSSASVSTTLSMTTTASSRMSSSILTGTTTMDPIDTSPIADPDTSNYSAPDIAGQAFMAFLGDVLSAAIGIGPGPSGFSVVVGSANSTASLSSFALMSSLPTTIHTSSLPIAVTSTGVAAGFPNPGGVTSQVSSVEAASSQATLASAAASSSSTFSAVFAILGNEITQPAGQLANTHTTLSLGVTATSEVPMSTAAANGAAIGSGIAAILNQGASASAASVSAANAAAMSSSAAANDAAVGSAVVAILNEGVSASAVSASAANAASPSPITPSSAAPSPDPSPVSTGPKWGIYLAYQIYTWGGANPMTDYYYKVWMTDLTKSPSGPDFCAEKSWIANVQINDMVDNVPPYPTKDFDFAIPAKIVGPAAIPCIWQPSPGNSQPGSMTCNLGETVLCTIPATTAITCKGDNPDRIEPLAQCVWQ